jgi:hypothetical protein
MACQELPSWVFWHALESAMACLGGWHDMPWWVPWHALVCAMACQNESTPHKFFFARAICPKYVSKFIIRHLEGVPSFKSKVHSGALVGAMACLGVCHGMPKLVDAAQIFVLPVPFAQIVFLTSL